MPVIVMYTFSLGFGVVYPVHDIASKQNGRERSVKFIKDLVTEALSIINESSMSPKQKREKLSTYVNKFLDLDRIARAVFAKWRYKNLPSTDQDKVKTYLKKYLLYFYAGEGKLSTMMQATLLSEPTVTTKGNDFAVTTQFTKEYGKPTTIIWVTDGQKIYYIEIEGINQIITLRSEMLAEIGSKDLMDYINNSLDSN